MAIGPAGQLVECRKNTVLRRRSVTKMRWNKYEVSLTSPVRTRIRQPTSEIKFTVVAIIIIIIIIIISCRYRLSYMA